ncbi:hypothetical protein HHI36_005162 [Cryptolaemus montrouzieri]|uniref:Retroviral polymerase SH3-like domain-containing protein n=1 Tax=Cryptolaemus montrouzieri TaxID=559131 RepID=A0ABD2NTL0_9CUCU
MTEETLTRVMRFSTSYEMWMVLHRLYDGSIVDKSYDSCTQFFGYKRERGDEMVTDTSKLKNILNQLQEKIGRSKTASSLLCNCQLPELLLVCKILDTLRDEVFFLKSGWMLMSASDRTIGSFTSQLCAFEEALAVKVNYDLEVLAAEKSSFVRIGKIMMKIMNFGTDFIVIVASILGIRKTFDRKTTEGVLVAYNNNDGYRIWCKDLRKVIRSRDVTFDEIHLNFAEICEEPCHSQNLQSEEDDIEESSKSLIEDFTNDVSEDDEDKNEDEDRYVNQDEDLVDVEEQLRSRNEIRTPTRYKDYIMNADY